MRALARELGVPSADKPATPCLASRIPYGTAVDPETLARIDRAERAVRALGFPMLRVRHHGILGRLEVAADDLDRALEQRAGDRRRDPRRRLHARGHRPRAVPVGAPQRGAAEPGVVFPGMIERALFGATGHESSRTIFGAAALGSVSKQDADRTLELLLEHGINHIDVAASYGDAELRIATWLQRHEGEFFVATKTDKRTYREAREEIRRSLDRLGVDHVDSIQLHNLVDVIEWETALGADGALEAAIEAREEGLVRFIGVTGHGLSIPEMHRRSLERFAFDSVLCPYNFPQMQDARYAETFEALAAVCQERNVALQTIKSLASRRWDGRAATAATWYEPLREQADIDLAVHWVLGRPDAFLLTAGDVELLPRVLDAAERFEQRPSDEEMAELVRRRDLAPLFV